MHCGEHVREIPTRALSGMNRSPMTNTRREVILDPALMLNDPFPEYFEVVQTEQKQLVDLLALPMTEAFRTPIIS
jgi:hypothetical protein